MPKEIGPREKALREQREAKWDTQLRDRRRLNRANEIIALETDMAAARQKRGKPRKKK